MKDLDSEAYRGLTVLKAADMMTKDVARSTQKEGGIFYEGIH